MTTNVEAAVAISRIRHLGVAEYVSQTEGAMMYAWDYVHEFAWKKGHQRLESYAYFTKTDEDEFNATAALGMRPTATIMWGRVGFEEAFPDREKRMEFLTKQGHLIVSVMKSHGLQVSWLQCDPRSAIVVY